MTLTGHCQIVNGTQKILFGASFIYTLIVMDIGYKLSATHPEKHANWFSKAFFVWLLPLIRKGTNKRLELTDIYENLDENQSTNLTDTLEKYWNDELARDKNDTGSPSLLRAIIKTQYKAVLRCGIFWGAMHLVFINSRPVILVKILLVFGDTTKNRTAELYIYVIALIFFTFLQVFANRLSMFGLLNVGMRVRVALSSLMYRKIIKLNQKVFAETTVGQMVNLLSNDVQRFDQLFVLIHVLWTMPIQTVIVSYILYQQVGISSFAGVVATFLVTLPIQSITAKFIVNFRKKIAKKTDIRVRLMNEVIAGIKVIKMYAWEKPFRSLIQLSRDAEIKYLTKALYLKGIYVNYMLYLDKFGLCATLVCFVLLGYRVTAAVVFSVYQCYVLFLWTLGIIFPISLTNISEALVTVGRLETFLKQEEKSHNLKELNTRDVTLSKVEASWNSNEFTLKDIDLQIPAGCLCAIVGPVGAGKSTLLQLLLGELSNTSGSIQIGRNVSYCSQKPWIFFSTVRSNILFGKTYEKNWYDKVVNVCALEKDFDQFPEGDLSIVGEKGVLLSGGQQARINLARAVYQKGDIYLLDDPLSAVDTHVGKHLFEQCIFHQLKEKTRILVTHQLQYLEKADMIVVINNVSEILPNIVRTMFRLAHWRSKVLLAMFQGRIEAQGSFEEITHSTKCFMDILTSSGDANKKEEEEIVNSEKYTSSADGINDSKSYQINKIDQERCGNLNGTPYKDYFFKMGKMSLTLSVAFLILITQLLNIIIDLWITYWTSQEETRQSFEKYETNSTKNDITIYHVSKWYDIFEYIQKNGESYRLLKTNFALYFYISLMVAFIFLSYLRSLLFFKSCMISSTTIHSKVFESLIKAPMRFFDRNPSGRILNIFSKDMGTIDEIFPINLLEATQIVLIVAGLIITITISNPYMGIVSVALVFAFLRFNVLYGSTTKGLKHIEGIAKSPVFSHVNLTINGIKTIRASKAEELLIKEFDQHQNVHTSISYLISACTCSFGFWIDFVVIAFLACVTFSSVFISNLIDNSTGLVGLAIGQCLNMTGRIQFGLRQTGEVINNITAVERILQYTEIDNEGPFETIEKKIPKVRWPQDGYVEFKNLSMKYIKDDPPVLKNLNFSIYAGQKIGIVGRTGAGKSSLISALFHLAPLEGSIVIDGVDTKDLGLTDLRKRISIIPQEPVLFSATLRYNLDPFNEFDDDKIWNALEQVKLRDSVESLDFLVAEGGANFSLGQRQLVCLARAILRDNKILVLDEATANVDNRTDSLIQATIREKFADCTVLTIAHRLNTIMDSDKVLVMSFGAMVEFDHPQKLLQIEDGYFYKMVLETGPAMSLQLINTAKDAYFHKNEK